jgi:hypothetical protein
VRSLGLALLFLAACGTPAVPPAPKAPVRPAAPPALAEKVDEPSLPPVPAPDPIPEETDRSRSLTRSARLLGGLDADGDGVFADVQKQKWFKTHAKEMSVAWDVHERERMATARTWADGALADVRARTRVVFYPFGGPDALYPVNLFPEARSYVLVGLEPVGLPPQLEQVENRDLQDLFKQVGTSIKPMLRLSFFRTEDMQRRLKEPGVLPLLIVLLARGGYRIQEVDLLSIQPNGTASQWAAGGDDASAPAGARVIFLRPGQQPQHLFYFQQNLSDDVLPAQPAFAAVLRTLDPPTTYLKAASYLLHKPQFSAIRELILERSAVVLQDDSGMPYRYFDREHWDAHLFGTFTGPIQIFAQYRQPELADAFRDGGADALPFGIGYKFKRGQSNLILMVRHGP